MVAANLVETGANFVSKPSFRKVLIFYFYPLIKKQAMLGDDDDDDDDSSKPRQEAHKMARNDENLMDENTRSVDTSCFLFCLACCCCHQKEKNLNSQKPYLVSI